jgi:hypothetical protein
MAMAPSGELLSASQASLLMARARQLVRILDLFHQPQVLKNQVVPPCCAEEAQQCGVTGVQRST